MTRLLVAFSENDDSSTAPLFSSERREGVSLSQQRLTELSRLYSSFYARLVAAVSDGLRAGGLTEAASPVLVRASVVPAAHFLIDRLTRMDLLLRRESGPFAVPDGRPVEGIGDILSFRRAIILSEEFNQHVLWRVAPLLGLERAAARPAIDRSPGPFYFVNRNFEGSTLVQRARRRALETAGRFLRGMGLGHPVPVLSMAYHTEPLRNEGFYFLRLEAVRGRLRPVEPAKDARTRAVVAATAAEARAGASEMLRAAGFSRSEAYEGAVKELGAFLAEHYPAALLEGAADNMARAGEVLAPFGRRPLVVAEGNDDESQLLIAAARECGHAVIGVQHGGHSGYIDDHVGAVEIDYPCYDRFVSWGWDTMPDMDVCRSIPVTPLPSPWLSERARHWSRALPARRRDPRGKPFAFLLMSNKIYPFPPSPSGASVSRTDRLAETCASLSALVGVCQARGVRLLHKLYDAETERLMAGALAAATRSPAYASAGTRDKGLSAGLLERCGVVLWDQPGTGFLECLAAGIPTMTLWPRHYNHEEARWRPLFAEMEDAGLVSRTPMAVLDSWERFHRDPASWIADSRRMEVSARFQRRFGWSETGWARRWRAFLDEQAAQ